MQKEKRRIRAGTAAVLTCAMLVTGLPLTVRAQPEISGQSEPEPIVYFDMEDVADGKLINKADGTEFVINGKTQEQTASTGAYGQALKFDGTNYIDLGTIYQPENEYTMAGWIKQDSAGTEGQVVFGRGYSGNVDDQLAIMIKNETLYHMASLEQNGNNSNYQEISAAPVMAGKWNHVAVTRDANELKIYINGQIVEEKSDFVSGGFVEADKKMYIGMDCDGNGNLYSMHAFQGAMDELRLYDTALTEEQIAELAYIEPACEIVDFANGSLTVHLTETPEQTPKQEDFDLTFMVDDDKENVTITGFQYLNEEQAVLFTFDPLINYQMRERTLKVTIGYQDAEVSGETVIPAGTNQAPQAENLVIENISPKLGEEPHVKGMLELNYTFTDPDNDAEGETKYQWYISDSPEGEYAPLQGINTKTIILLDKYVGKYLKCEVMPADIHGNKGTAVTSAASEEAVQDTEGNPLTDWFLEAKYGISHHFLANYFNEPDVSTEEREKWDIENVSWNDFVSQFDVEKYAEQVNETGAKFVTLTLGQNNGYYCAPNATYDKYMREAGLLKEGEANPKTTTEEFDLPMLMADALAKYDIKLILYLPANPPHSAHWNTEGTTGAGFIGTDYKITTEVFDYTPGTDGVPSQRARKVVWEMVEEWSERYGDKIAGWWFDGVFTGDLLESHTDMSLEYNIAGLANAAKAGNPYAMVTFNPGVGAPRCFEKTNDYQDITAGEQGGLAPLPESEGRWAPGTDDCQNYTFGVLGAADTWKGGWGCSGTSKTTEELVSKIQSGLERDCVMGMDTRVNVFGELDPEQFEQLKVVKAAIRDNADSDIGGIVLGESELVLENIGDREILKVSLEPIGVQPEKMNAYAEDESIVELRESTSGVYDILALAKGETKLIFESKTNPEIKAECKVTVNGRTPKEVLDNTSDKISYSENGEWYAPSGRPADPDGFYEYGQTVHASRVTGASATFTFEGNGFDMITGYNTDQGKVSVQVDQEEPVVVDTSVPDGGPKKAFGLNLYKRYDLEAGEHTVTITNLEDKYMIIDAFRIYEDTEQETVSKNTLEYFLNSAKEHVADGDVDNCVESIQKLFEEAIAEGEAVMADADAARDEVMNAAMKLVKAIHALDMKAADKTDLEMAVELAGMIDLGRYVEAGQKEFTDALAAAREVLADGDALQGDVDAAWDALVTAMENLRMKADKAALEDLLDEGSGIDLSRYTEESVAVFRTALASAQAVFADETLSEDDQQKVDDAAAALKEARDGLAAADGSQGGQDPGNGDQGENQGEDTGNDNNNGTSENGGNTSGTGNADQNNGNSNSRNSVNKAAKTGDTAPIAGMMMLALVSGAAVLAVSRRKVK